MTRTLVTLALVACARGSEAQSEDLMGREIDQAVRRSVWDLGRFHLTPRFRFDLGYDSNAILTGDEANPDMSVVAAPGIGAVIPLRSRALLNLYQELDFVYYRELTELRNVNNVTRIGGAVGGKSLIFSVEDEFRAEQVRPSREFDVPVHQRSDLLNASLSYSLGFRHELSFDFERYRVQIQDSELTVGGAPIQSLLDRTENTYSLTFTRHLSSETTMFFGGFYETQDFDDKTVGRDAGGWGALVGFEFSPTGNVRGAANVGYERIVPEVMTQPGFAGLVGAVDVKLGLGQRFALQGMFSRDTQPSILSDNPFVVVTRYGMALDVYLGPLFFIQPGFTLGSNNYPDSVTLREEEEVSQVLIRAYKAVTLSFNYRMSPTWLVTLGTRFSRRDTSSVTSVEDRFVINFGVRSTF